jgi:hypothetical protein
MFFKILFSYNKTEFKDTLRMFFILIILSIPFFFFYKTTHEIYSLISVLSLCGLNHFLSYKLKFLYIEPRLYLSLFIPLIMLYFNII